MPLSVSHSRSWAVWPTHPSQNCFCHGLRAEQARQLFKGVFAAEDNRKHPSFRSTHVFTTPTYIISNWSKKKKKPLIQQNPEEMFLPLLYTYIAWSFSEGKYLLLNPRPILWEVGRKATLDAFTLMVWKRGGAFCMANNLFSEYLFWLCFHGYAY